MIAQQAYTCQTALTGTLEIRFADTQSSGGMMVAGIVASGAQGTGTENLNNCGLRIKSARTGLREHHVNEKG
jgi:hypothetical protein